MRTALAGQRHAGLASFRVVVLALSLGLLACSGKPATGALQVLVQLEPGLITHCVKVTATDGTNSKETKAITLADKTSPLHVAVYGDGLVQPVTIQAVGYSDDGCTMLSREVSETVEGTFTNPPSTVTVTLRPDASGDGGFRPDGGGSDGGGDAGVDGGADAGTDAGQLDAGVDVDMDGYPLPADCDDSDPAIHPFASESCTNGIDDDCNFFSDCQDTNCDTFRCVVGMNSFCTAGVCIGTIESPCNDGMDNNNNGLIDCADPGCAVGTTCTDNNSCTTGDRCIPDGGCAKMGDVMCTTPPNGGVCYAASGTCLPDAGASCQYTPLAGPCNDGLGCTTNDTCTTAGSCGGTLRACPDSANTCLTTAGTCQEPDGGCFNAPLPQGSGTCSDGMNCTTNDACDGDGGCKGTPVACSPSQCFASSGCTTGGACLFNVVSGQVCDAGTGAGTCEADAGCTANPASLFPYTPSNFAESQLPNDGGIGFAVPSSRTLNTDTATLTVGTMPPFTVITPVGGEPSLLVRVTSFTVSGGAPLTISGARPVIFAVIGNVQLDGVIRARNGGGAATSCGNGGNGTAAGTGSGLGGGGGAGYGTSGAAGGTSGGGGAGAAGSANGQTNLNLIRAGCNGGRGSATGALGGMGGGAVQISTTGSITINGTLTVPGDGGNGAAATGGLSGGGGGSGGGIVLEAVTATLTSNARITANGGSGGEGSGGNSGNDGRSANEDSAAVTPNGGNNSPAGGNGGVGAGGAGPATPGGSVGNNDGAGGGGGGVGRIRFNATSCILTGSGQVISPAQTGTTCT